MNKEDFNPEELADVEYHIEGDRAKLVFSLDLHHPPEKVWSALTDPEQLREWAPFTPDRNLAELGPAMITDLDNAQEMPVKVLQSIPPTLLEYSIEEDLLSWELSPIDAGTRLTLRHTVESPDWVLKVAAGWHMCLVVAEKLLDGRPIGPVSRAKVKELGWLELHDAYGGKLGIVGTGWPEGMD